MAADTWVVLPGREEMRVRLLAVDGSAHLEQKFYELLLRRAGEKNTIEGVISTVLLYLHRYVVGAGLSADLFQALMMRVPEFIAALVVDPVVADEAKALYEQARVQALDR